MNTITVLVPTWRRPHLLRRCLHGLAAQLRPPDEILVALREEDTEARSVVSDFARELPIHEALVTQSGHLPPIEAGRRAAHGDLVAILDDDAVPAPDWLAEVERAMVNETVAVVGGYVQVPEYGGTPPRRTSSHDLIGRVRSNVWSNPDGPARPAVALIECNMIWRTPVLQSLDLNPLFNRGDAIGYGLDLVLQAKRMGHEAIYDPRIRVLHTPGPRDPLYAREDQHRQAVSYARNYGFLAASHYGVFLLTRFILGQVLIGVDRSPGLLRAVLRGSSVNVVIASVRGLREGLAAGWKRRSTFSAARFHR